MAATFEKKLASTVENLSVLYDKTLKEFKDNSKKKRMHGNKLHSSWAWSQVSDIKVAEISRANQCFLPVKLYNLRFLEPNILGKRKESRKRRNRERLPTKHLVPSKKPVTRFPISTL